MRSTHASLRNVLLVSPLVLTLGFMACIDDSEEYRQAPPTADEISITAPGGQQSGKGTAGMSQQALTGKTSEFYQVTWAISADLNTRAAILLGLMRLSTLGAPSERTLNSRTWGPYTPGGLDPLSYRVVVTKLGVGHFSYAFEGKVAANTSSAFSTLISGDITRGEARGQGKGEVVLHFDNLRALRPDNTCEQGTIRGQFDNTKSPASLEIFFDQFANNNPKNTVCKSDTPKDAYYYFDRGEGGAGNFVFSVDMNVHNDADKKPGLETVSIRSRWLADGKGRSDVRVEGGEVKTDLEALSASTNFLAVSQCWTTSFVTSYETAEPALLGLFVTNGDATTCAFTSADLPE